MDYSGSGEGHVAGSCAHGNETSGSIKCGEFLNYTLWRYSSFSRRVLSLGVCEIDRSIDKLD